MAFCSSQTISPVLETAFSRSGRVIRMEFNDLWRRDAEIIGNACGSKGVSDDIRFLVPNERSVAGYLS